MSVNAHLLDFNMVFIDLNIKTSIYNLFLSEYCGYIYIVHQRTLGILLASIIVITIMKILNKISIKQFLSFIIPIIIIMIFHIRIKDIILTNLWLNGSGVAINDYSGQLNKINLLLSVEGLIKFAKVFIGHLFYLGTATFLMVYLGLLELIQRIFNIDKNNTDENSIFFYGFIFISFVITLAISAIFFINPVSIDNIVYGRYNEIIICPLFLIGFKRFINIKKLTNKQYLVLIFLFLLLTTITYLIIMNSGINIMNVDNIHALAVNSMNNKIGIFFPALISIIMCRLIWISFQKRNINLIILTIAVISLIYCSFGLITSMVIANQQQDMLDILKVTDKINSNKEDLPIYFVFENPDEYEAVQWNGRQIRDRSVSIVTSLF